MTYKTLAEWIDDDGWKDETEQQCLDRLVTMCLSIRKTTSYKFFSRNQMLKSYNKSELLEKDQIHINDNAKVMQRILEHLGAKRRRMSDFC